MSEGILGILTGMLAIVSFFATTFGIVYLHKRERMAMIERGMDPRAYTAQPAPYKNLKWGLLLMGAGIGLFLALVLHLTVFKEAGDATPAIFFSLISICGGAGLVLSYKIEKKELLDKQA